LPGIDWTDVENDVVVADYFDMLEAELADVPYVKSHHRKGLLLGLSSRSEGAVEFKYQNISAVLLGLGQPWIIGYKPATNFQIPLIDAVLRHMNVRQPWTHEAIEARKSSRTGLVVAREAPALWFGPPPTHSNAPPPVDAERMAAIARRYDVAERDLKNRALGEAGEELVLQHEKTRLRQIGCQDLADQVLWTSKEVGDGAGYDIQSYDDDGQTMLIEVKTTNGWERTPFHISRNELAIAEDNREQWHLYRLWNFAREPKAFSLRPPLQSHIALTPTSFLATLH
jgi:hypothetical protein